MEGYTLKQLKGFKFKVIKDMFDKAFKRVNTFVDYKTELVEDDDQEEARMKELINIVPTEEEVVIDDIPLATKPLCIVDWKIIKEGKISQFQIIRADGSSKRVHFLRLQSMQIFMLVEKWYPLTPATITGMLNKKLQVDHWNEMCYQILKLITKHLKNPGSGRIVGIKSFIRLFGITVTLIKVSAAQEESLDDLFNNLKAYESEVKGTSSSTTNSHNVAFLSSSSTNSATRAVNTAQGVNTASTQGQEDSLRILEGSWTWPTKKELGLTSPRWSVSTATKWDTLQESAGHPGIKTAGTRAYKRLCQLRKTT
ncbi:hypothetical protein Tco_1418504 [Tanacetum coccineum]